MNRCKTIFCKLYLNIIKVFRIEAEFDKDRWRIWFNDADKAVK